MRNKKIQLSYEKIHNSLGKLYHLVVRYIINTP